MCPVCGFSLLLSALLREETLCDPSHAASSSRSRSTSLQGGRRPQGVRRVPGCLPTEPGGGTAGCRPWDRRSRRAWGARLAKLQMRGRVCCHRPP